MYPTLLPDGGISLSFFQMKVFILSFQMSPCSEHKSSVHIISPVNRILKVLLLSGLKGKVWRGFRVKHIWKVLCCHPRNRGRKAALNGEWHRTARHVAPPFLPCPLLNKPSTRGCVSQTKLQTQNWECSIQVLKKCCKPGIKQNIEHKLLIA